MNNLQALKDWVEFNIKLCIEKGDYTNMNHYVQIMDLINQKEKTKWNITSQDTTRTEAVGLKRGYKLIYLVVVTVLVKEK